MLQHASVKPHGAFVAFLLLITAACNTSPNATTTAFQGPSGMVLAGHNFQRLFIANAGIDTLQVADISSGFGGVNMVKSPARYWPLNIPAGPNPTELAATVDGRYVLVLDLVTSSIRMLDADALTLVTNPNTELSLGNAEPGAMVGAPCPADAVVADGTCLGRAYVALRASGMIAVLNVVRGNDANATVSLQPVRNISVGNGSPWRLAVDSKGSVLYATDTQRPVLMRITLNESGADVVDDSTALQRGGGPVAVSSDDNFVVVGRPDMRDVLVFGTNPNDALALQDANPRYAPAPRCLQPCFGADDSTLCQDAHIADLSVCASGTGLASGPLPNYGAVYLGKIPAQLASIGKARTGQQLQEKCVAPRSDMTTSVYDESIAVATLDGLVSFIGLTDQEGATKIHLIETAACSNPTATITTTTAANVFKPAQYLAPCVDTPEGRNAFACLEDPNDSTPQSVVIARGNADGQAWTFNWEGIIIDRNLSNPGQITADGFVDPGQDLTGLGIATPNKNPFGAPATYGDILEITAGAFSDACYTALGVAPMTAGSAARPTCPLERRITNVSLNPGGGSLVSVDRPFPAACISGNVGYRIRVGDGFLVSGTMPAASGGGSVTTRLRSGDSIGAGLSDESTYGTLFRISPTIASQSHGEAPACARYNGGNPNEALGMAPFMTRNTTYGFTVNDPFRIAQTGVNINPQGQAQGNVGSMPSGIAVTRQSDNPSPMLFVSYAGTNAVIVSVPFDTSNLMNTNSTFKVLN